MTNGGEGPRASHTRWRDKAYEPQSYDETAVLVKLARDARKERIVEFDWYFTHEEIHRLRRAVFEWGSSTVGRYRCFDARVLAAMRDALGDMHTAFALNEPKNSTWIDAVVSCIPDGDGFRLKGHAPFDIIFGYAHGAIEARPWRVHLGESVAQTLEQAARDLGWEIKILQQERLRPVRNTLFGFPASDGVNPDAVAAEQTGEPEDVLVHFRGPYSAFHDSGRCLFTDPIASDVGIYLWTFQNGPEYRVWYVGQTSRGFGQRTGEHIAAYLSGQYETYDVESMRLGVLRTVNRAEAGVRWPESLPTFLENAELALPKILELIRAVRFYVAPLPNDPHLLNRAEGAIGRYFKTHAEEPCRNFFLPGIKLPQLIPYDRKMRFLISSEVPIVGLREVIVE